MPPVRALSPITRADFQNLSQLRLAEAQALLSGRFPEGAFYLAGYAVECALKACISRQQPSQQFPPRQGSWSRLYTHDLEALIDAAGLKAILQAARASDPDLDANWAAVLDWSEQSRYAFPNAADALNLYDAVTDQNHGALQWLRTFW